jgi:integrase
LTARGAVSRVLTREFLLLADLPEIRHYPVGSSAKGEISSMSAQLRLVRPRHENRSVPVRPPNDELRSREYLTVAEVERLMKAAQHGRYGHRDATLILVAFRHGLRAAEICDLEWSQVEFGRSASLHVRRVKNGKPSVHPLRGNEIRALRELRRQFPDSGFVFATERGGPFTPDAVNRLIKRIGERAGLAFPVHCHMLRHACGYALANSGHDTRALQDWLGHRSIQHTVRYTELSPTRFKDFWRE